MAYIYTPFMKKVLHITKRKRKSNVHHYCKTDDFRAGFEVAKWGTFCHSAWLQISPARFKQVYSDSALQLLRRYITKDGVIIASFNWHPADQFVYKMKIDSNRGAKINNLSSNV